MGQERANLHVLRQFAGDELKFLVAHNRFRGVSFFARRSGGAGAGIATYELGKESRAGC